VGDRSLQVLLPQLPVQLLPASGPGHLILFDEVHAFRSFEPRHLVSAELHELLAGGFLALLEDNHGLHGLAPFVVRDPEDRRIVDRGVLAEDVLHLRGIDVLAPGDYHVVLSVNDLGSIQSVNELLEVKDPDRRVTRGITLTGIANIASGIFGVIGPVNYSLSVGVFLSTGCASRFTLLPAAAITFALAFLPGVTGFISSVPSVVIGSLLIYIMTSQVAAGLIVVFRDKERTGFQFEKGLVIGLSLLLGTIVAFLPPDVIRYFPPFLRPILGNGFAVGIASALILEHIIFRKGVK